MREPRSGTPDLEDGSRRPAAVLFDLDGVLADSYQVWKALLQEAAAHFGGPPVTDEAFRAVWGQDSGADVEHFLPSVKVADLERFYSDCFHVHACRVRPMPGARGLLEHLLNRGVGRAVVTNAPRAAADATLQTIGLDAFIETVVGADEVRRAKPAPDMLILALRRLGAEAGESVMVGDSRFDRQAGSAAGVPVIGLGLDADWRVESLDQIPALLDQLAAGD